MRLFALFVLFFTAYALISPYMIGNGEYGGMSALNERSLTKREVQTLCDAMRNSLIGNQYDNICLGNVLHVSMRQLIPLNSYFLDFLFDFQILRNTTLHEYQITKSSESFVLIKHLVNRNPKQLYSTSPISIMSYNIFNFNDHWDQRVDLITKSIKNHLPDIIGFQEVRLDEMQPNFENSQHQMSHLRTRLDPLGYKYYLHQSAMYYQSPRSEEGVSIFSRWPIIATEYILLSRDHADWNSHQRICLWALIETPSGLVQIFNTHLELRLEMSESNARDIIDFANKKLKEVKSPQILVGDMNAEPESQTVKILQKVFKDAFLENSQAQAPQEHEITFQTQQNYFKRIDFVFFRNWGRDVVEFKKVNERLDGNITIHASDHFGIVAKFHHKH